jgi:hypothetical protein
MSNDIVDPWRTHLELARTPRRLPADLTDAVRQLDDELTIRDLVVRYTYFHDAANLEDKVALHHPDCVVHHNTGDLHGLDAIRAFFKVGPPNDQVKDMRHYVTNSLVRFETADRATVTSFYTWTETRVFDDGGTNAAVGGGWYVDVVERFNGQWLFKERTIYRGYDFHIPGVPSFGALQVGAEGTTGANLERLREAGILVTQSGSRT